MRFTDKFITVPVKLCSRKEQEMELENVEYTDSIERIDPMEIERYFPTTDDNFDGECVQIYFKSGSGCVTYISLAAFETLLNNFKGETIYTKQ